MSGKDWQEWEQRTAPHPRARAWHRATITAFGVAIAGGAMLGIGLYFVPLLIIPGAVLTPIGLIALPITIAGTARASGRTSRQAVGESSRLTLKTLREILCGL